MISAHHELEARSVVAGYEKKEILHGISVRIPPNRISVLIGANACGKSTLLKTLARNIRPASGEVTLDGRAIATWKPRELARTLGMLPQTPLMPAGISVADLVGRGRYPHLGPFGNWKETDCEAVADALEAMGVARIADRPVGDLSGGQRQRVWIAMALAQRTDILLLDEPTTYLDIAHQIEILDSLAALNAKKGTTIVMVLHDLNLAARYADRLFAMKDGYIVAEGSPSEVIDTELVGEVYGLASEVIADPVTGTPLVVPGRSPRALCEA
jgi:iron complex transport system ATP-binding protein